MGKKELSVGLIKDDSEKYDRYNWHDEYAKHFLALGDKVDFLDFEKSNWMDQILQKDFDIFLWRACHRPDLRDDAKGKIYFIDKILNKRIFPNWNMYYPYDNKIVQLFLMDKFKIPHPKTFYSRDKAEIEKFIKNSKYPIISKSSDGACGDNVRKYDDPASLTKHIEQIFSEEGLPTYFPWVRQKGYVYLQEFLPVQKDLRIIVIGDKVELSFWRKNENSWIKNVSNGGKIYTNPVPENILNEAVSVNKKLNLHWCAFDIIVTNDKFYFLEFSSIFGFSRKTNYYEKAFGSPNAFVLEKQVKYLHNLFI